MYRTFEEQLTVGKKGENLVKAALAARGHSVEDLSNMREYQQKDIDFRISKNDASITLEIKNDIRSNETGNVFVEIYNRNNRSRGGDGWLCYCEADYLCFVQEQKKVAHIINRQELIKNCWGGKYRTANGYDAKGYIVPIGQLEKYSSYYCLKLGE